MPVAFACIERQSSSVYICVTFQREFVFITTKEKYTTHFTRGFIDKCKAINRECLAMTMYNYTCITMCTKIIDSSKLLERIKNCWFYQMHYTFITFIVYCAERYKKYICIVAH